MSDPSEHRVRDAPVLVALRTGTRRLHEAVEARPAMVRLLDETLTPEDYAACLSRLAGFHAALEPAVETWLGASPGLALIDRRKLLQDDMKAFGGIAGRPMPPFIWTTEAQAWGALYVTEGATLGGAVISRHLRRHAWMGAPLGRRYFLGYGPETGARWTAFRLALVDACAGRAAFIAEAVDAARTVFARLDLHMADEDDDTAGTGPGGPEMRKTASAAAHPVCPPA